MAMLPSSFNSEQHDDMGSFDAMPAGEYIMMISESVLKPTKKALEEKNGNDALPIEAYSGLRLNLTFKIVGGEHDGRQIFNGLNIRNPNPQAVEISQKELATICRACNKVAIKDSAELHGIPMLVKIGVKNNAEYGPQNTFKGYKPFNGTAPAQTGAAAPTSTAAGAAGKGKKLWDQ